MAVDVEFDAKSGSPVATVLKILAALPFSSAGENEVRRIISHNFGNGTGGERHAQSE